MIKPPQLSAGDSVAIVTPSWGGPAVFPGRYQAGLRQLQSEFDLQPVEMPHTLADPNWLAANPQARAADLMQAFADPTIKGIIAAIGGDDSIRLLPYLELDIIRANPKVFLGYSDTTIQHLACYKAGLVSFYGPSIMSGFAENGGLFPYTIRSLRRTLFSDRPIGELRPNRDGWTVERLEWADLDNQERRRKLNPSTGWNFLQGQGRHQGRLIGGCLEVLDWLRGTAFWPSLDEWDGAILFLETSEDAPPPEAVRYFLRSLAALDVLPRLSGLLFARPGGSVPPADFPRYDLAFLQVVAAEQGLPDLPVVTGMDFGHTDPMLVLPYGVTAEIDCDLRRVSILESAVSPRPHA